MADHGNHDENYTSNAGVMYESSDANVRAIYIFGVWLVSARRIMRAGYVRWPPLPGVSGNE